MARPVLNVVRLAAGRLGIFDQLRLEEALLRTDAGNWCIVNHGETKPHIVMGISGKPEKLVNLAAASALSVPIIRRFTGGGTVITDENTLYISLIMNKAQVPSSPLYPREVMKWSESFYAPVFNSLAPASAVVTAPFQLREHDYCFGEHKFGGNAQSISRDRWVHHTSMLWDYTPQLMSLLTLPDNRPDYRKDRDHGAFLTKLRERLHPHDREALVDRVLDRARETWDLHQVPLEQALGVLQRPQERASNTYVDY